VGNVTVRAPTRDDIPRLLAELRPLDRQELLACHDEDDLPEVLRLALLASPQRYAIDIKGELAILGGFAVISLLSGMASPWLLGTHIAARSPTALTRVSVRYVGQALNRFPHLVNTVDARNEASIRWLKRLGFTIAKTPEPYGRHGLPFYRFEMRKT
jgi:hypothetical protein